MNVHVSIDAPAAPKWSVARKKSLTLGAPTPDVIQRCDVPTSIRAGYLSVLTNPPT
jgi:hypothetical protein